MFGALLKINVIAGESTGDAHKNWMDILRLQLAGEPADGQGEQSRGVVTARTEGLSGTACHYGKG